MHNDLYVLIDIGGTAIKHGIATLDGNLQERAELPTEAQEFGGPGIVQKVKKICSDALSKYGSQIKGVSISTAGMVDPEQGKIVYALPDAIPDYTGVNFKELISHDFNLPCEVENDVNCAALGETWLGAGKGCHDVFCMTIGTSIGGAMVCDGKLVSGASNSAGEIAYMRVPGGMLHELASTTHLVKHYAALKGITGESLKEVNGKRIFDEAESGDATAIAAIDDLVEHLSDGITNVVSVQNPQAVILGGGIMARDAYLRPRLEAALKSKLRDIVFKATRIEFAQLRNDAGMLGGFYHFKQRRGL